MAKKQVRYGIVGIGKQGTFYTKIFTKLSSLVKGAKLTNKDAIPGSDAESDLKEWLVSAKRKKGDVTVIKGSTGAYIVQFQSRNNNKEKTDESGDMNLCDYIAQNLLRGDALQKWQEEKLGVVTKDAKATTSFGAMYIGR